MSGTVKVPPLDLPGVVEVVGIPIVENERVTISILSAKVNGEDLPQSLVDEVEVAVNNVFAQLLRGMRVQTAELSEGSLRIVALEQK